MAVANCAGPNPTQTTSNGGGTFAVGELRAGSTILVDSVSEVMIKSRIPLVVQKQDGRYKEGRKLIVDSTKVMTWSQELGSKLQELEL